MKKIINKNKLIVEARGEDLIDSIVKAFLSEIKKDDFKLINEKLLQDNSSTKNLTVIMGFDQNDDKQQVNINEFLSNQNENLILNSNFFISPLKELKKIIVSLHISFFSRGSIPESQLYQNSNGIYHIDYNNNNFDVMHLELNQNVAMSSEEENVYKLKISSTNSPEEKNKIRTERDSKKTFNNLIINLIDHIENELYNVGLHELNHGLQKHDKSISTKKLGKFSKGYLDEKQNTNEFIIKTTKPFKINNLSYIQNLISNIKNEIDSNVIQKYLNKLDGREIDSYVRSSFSIAKRKFKQDNSKSVVMHFIENIIRDVKQFWTSDIDKNNKIGIILLYLSYAAIHFPTGKFTEFDKDLNTNLNFRSLLKNKYGLTKLMGLILAKIK